ncbi:MAG TPA: OmpA family protein, partial [Candidatus Atribacteria bacterium]|nr:OmpA family protein [Candidatus Atribacteria bacterium]
DLPIHTSQFPSNWELSAARAIAVLRYLVEEKGLPPERLMAVGYGEYRPLAPNVDEEHRQKNRRVEIVILRD